MPRASAAALTLPESRAQRRRDVVLLHLLEGQPGRERRGAGRRLPGDEGEVRGAEDAALAGHEGPLDGVFELAHVPRPVVVHEQAQRLLGDAGHLAAQLVGEAVEELLREERHVLDPLPKRREVDVDHVEPVVEVVAEAALRARPAARSRWVAAMTRTSTAISAVPPTR